VIIDSKNFRGSVNHIPYPDGFIARSRNDKPPISGEIKRGDSLLVTIKNVADALVCDIPDLGCMSVGSQETPESVDDVLVFVCLKLQWQDIYHLG